MSKHATHLKKMGKISKIIKIILGAIIAMMLFIVLYSLTIISNAPDINPDDIYANLSESSVLYDDENNPMENVYIDGGNRVNVDYNKMPKNLINAVVSIEDKTFWSHHGFNVIRIFGAIKDSIFSRANIGGTSTITQQLSRNVYLSETKSVRSLNRKVTEAWYTILLERNLSKKQIIEAYLNTIYFGYNSYGVQSASQAYFSKNVEDLNLNECIALASIPKSPEYYSLVKTIDNTTSEADALKLKKKDILYKSLDYLVVYNGDAGKDRRELILQNMYDQGYITADEEKTVSKTSIKSDLDINNNAYFSHSSYFSDFVIDEVINDLTDEGYAYSAAKKMVYTGGLKIYTSMSSKVQDAIEDAFSQNSNFPSVANIIYDKNGNIINKSGNILMYKYSNFFNSEKHFILTSDEYYKESSGNLILKSGKRLKFYNSETKGESDVTIEFKSLYKIKSNVIYYISGGTLLIPQGYKHKNSNGDLVISADFLASNPDFFVSFGDSYIIKEQSYNLNQEVRQPQGAMVICDYRTGEIKGLIGGRSTAGKLLYNRALSTRQPGSSIKPLSIYSTAIQQGADAATSGTNMKFKNYDKNQVTSGYGNYWTASSKINDAPLTINGQIWPKNWYNGYLGMITLRKSVEQSVNVNAVRVFQQIGSTAAIEQLNKFGITSIVTSGSPNDKNASALALGGMTKGISPIEMASAYGIFANQGEHIDYTGYTKIKNKNNEVILEKAQKKTKVLSKGVAFIMSDILRTTVTNGVAKDANTDKITAGKTGTTSDNFDAWFCGFTPQYSAACWIGNDINIELSEGSSIAAKLWSKVMTVATSGMSGSLPSQPNTVVKVNGEYYINESQNVEKEKQQVSVEICSKSGYIATPWCTDRTTKIMDADDKHAKYYCPIHNQDPTKYPIPPGYSVTIDKTESNEKSE